MSLAVGQKQGDCVGVTEDRWRFGSRSRSDPWQSEDLLQVCGPVGMWGGRSRALLDIGERKEGHSGCRGRRIACVEKGDTAGGDL